MGSVGDKLRQARESQDRSLAEIAAEIRINAGYLAAIEAEDLENLPGGFFTRSFVFQYARVLGVPEHEIEREVDELLAEEKSPFIPGQEPRKAGSDLPPLPYYAKGRRKRSRWPVDAVAILLLVVVGCAAIYSLWLKRKESAPPTDSAIAETSAPASVVPSDEAAPEREAASLTARPGVESFAVAAPIAMEGPLWFRIAATEETWVDVTSGGRRLFQGILQPGDTRSLSGLARARLLVGNAGGLEIVSNGKPVGPIGSRGQVRVVTLTPDGARISAPMGGAPAGALEPETENSTGG